MENVFVCIYLKKGKIKVLSLNDSKKEHTNLIMDGWKHTETIQILWWLECLLEYSDDEIIREIKYLRGE